jgi:hypothetical protein
MAKTDDLDLTIRTELERRLDAALHETLAELEAVKARLDALVGAFEKNGSLGILQMFAADKTLPVALRMRAAGLAVPYEKAKPAASSLIGVVDFREVVRTARLKQEALDRAKWEAENAATIEHQPGTILGDGQDEPPAA